MTHLKRQKMPGFWPLARKEERFAVVPIPGPHPKATSIPITIVIRDILKLGKTSRDAKKILNNKEILVDGKEITERRFPVGLMDIITNKGNKENYLVLPSKKSFELKKISDKDADSKYCKIIGKTMVKKGLQLNLHNGKNILLSKEDKDKYMVSDTIKISIKSKKILEVVPYKEGSEVLIIRGRNKGVKGKLKKIIINKDLQGQRAEIEINGEDKIFKRDLIFVVPNGF